MLGTGSVLACNLQHLLEGSCDGGDDDDGGGDDDDDDDDDTEHKLMIMIMVVVCGDFCHVDRESSSEFLEFEIQTQRKETQMNESWHEDMLITFFIIKTSINTAKSKKKNNSIIFPQRLSPTPHPPPPNQKSKQTAYFSSPWWLIS